MPRDGATIFGDLIGKLDASHVRARAGASGRLQTRPVCAVRNGLSVSKIGYTATKSQGWAMLDNLFGEEMPLGVRFLIALIFIAAVAAAVVVAIRWLRPSKKIKVDYVPPPPPIEIASIVEHETFSAGGAFAMLLLILSNIVAIFTYALASNILQQNVAMLGWIGWNILWGVGAIIGRKRTYTDYRTPPSP